MCSGDVITLFGSCFVEVGSSSFVYFMQFGVLYNAEMVGFGNREGGEQKWRKRRLHALHACPAIR